MIVSLAGPPKSGPESLQTGKILKYLDTNRHHFTYITENVLEGKAGGWNVSNPALLEMLKNIQEIHRLPALSDPYLRFAIGKLAKGLTYKPDPYFFFHWQWKKMARKTGCTPDIIYSRSTPFSSAVAARKLKAHFGCRWVMHLSDPWTLSPLYNIPDAYRDWHLQEEENCFREADIITFTSEKTIGLYAGKYPSIAEKFRYFPNVYDDEHIADGQSVPADKVTWVYTGNMYGDRTPEALFRAMATLQCEEPSVLEKHRFVFAGHMDEPIRDMFHKYDLPCVEYVGPLPFEEARRLQLSANILIAIDSPAAGDHAVFFPSKLLDYFVARKPVLAITGSDSTTRDVLDPDRNFVVTHDEISEIIKYIKQATQALEDEHYGLFQMPEPNPFYSASQTATRLQDLFDKL